MNACIADALHFGDVDDPNSNVSRLLREQRSFRMHEELGTEPGFYYVYGKADGADSADQSSCDRTALAAGVNCAPGASSRGINSTGTGRPPAISSVAAPAAGLFAFSAIASLRYGERRSRSAGLRSAFVALGLFLVLLKIGRPLRFIYVLRQPQRSWMAREAWIAAAFFPLAALAPWFEVPALTDRRRCRSACAVPLQPGHDPEGSEGHPGMADRRRSCR